MIAHAGCGYYKSRWPAHTAEKIHELQIQDLKSAAAWLRSTHQVHVDLFYVSGGDGALTFAAVAET